MLTMQGKVCPITGATNGIGKSTAQEHARTGATVVIVGRDAQKFTMELIRCLEETGVTVNALHTGFVSTGFGKNDPGFLMETIRAVVHRCGFYTPSRCKLRARSKQADVGTDFSRLPRRLF